MIWFVLNTILYLLSISYLTNLSSSLVHFLLHLSTFYYVFHQKYNFFRTSCCEAKHANHTQDVTFDVWYIDDLMHCKTSNCDNVSIDLLNLLLQIEKLFEPKRDLKPSCFEWRLQIFKLICCEISLRSDNVSDYRTWRTISHVNNCILSLFYDYYCCNGEVVCFHAEWVG